MLGKIKQLMQIKESIDELDKKIEKNQEKIDKLAGSIANLNDNFSEIRKSNDLLTKEISGSVDCLKEEKDVFKKEIHDFKVLKGHLQQKVLDKFEEELKAELKINIDAVKAERDSLDKMKEQLSVVSDRTIELSDEITKLTSISKKLNAKDFELEKFAKQLLEMDKEKLDLMRKIDQLERLISKMRRR